MKNFLFFSLFLVNSSILFGQSMQEFWCKIAEGFIPGKAVTRKNAVFFGTVQAKDPTANIVTLKKGIFGVINRSAVYDESSILKGETIDQSDDASAPIKYNITVTKTWDIGASLNIPNVAGIDANYGLSTKITISGTIDLGLEILELKKVNDYVKTASDKSTITNGKYYVYTGCYYVKSLEMQYDQTKIDTVKLKTTISSLLTSGTQIAPSFSQTSSSTGSMKLSYPYQGPDKAKRFYPFCAVSKIGEKETIQLIAVAQNR